MQASTKSKTTNPEFFETNQLMKKSNTNKQTGLFVIGQKILKGSDPYFLDLSSSFIFQYSKLVF